ncbi:MULTISPECIES: DUF441 domain-containing protein [Aneurinibacillus]|nr:MULTISPECIES: DUF441 domain-containing protein [Aneurinibacillus]AMA72984.1 hypothetical protein ACH33_09020 [Aneurinibacillus sp. XH2]MED0675932.1 DUF441 domain-containing protein [Aneurinibacillus thermoaerophilus]MED0677793.1 DUF441 domain-containing protein [Aneurinibacillus thermoaerophilus]MED0737542.1 DUF441 domain-containing protein [Aneurinibacillus thermoaerophilus]MED0758113.1 DUF441 domain-containing protein [Aneurinibacillus thermoaerophilus]
MHVSSGEAALVILIIVGLIGRSPIIATAASMLLMLKLTSLERFFPAVERRGMELGLLFLTISVLVPFASERITAKDLLPLFTTLMGVIALTGGALATYLNGKGLDMLRAQPHLIVGLVVGSIIGIVFLRGIPVGPLMAAAITALLLKFIYFVSKFF